MPARDLLPFLIRLAELASGPAEIGLVGELAAASGRPDLVVQVGRFAAYYGQVNEAAAFPIPELERLIRPPAGEPDAALLLGIARQESVFNSWGTSDQGAQGVLQLMPHTALLMARSLGLDYNRGLLTGNPDYNIRLGSHYLKTLLDRYDDATALAVAAYNAGPSRVDEWLRLHGDPRRGDRHALVDWVELIPFDETRNYVQRVLEGPPCTAGAWPNPQSRRSGSGRSTARSIRCRRLRSSPASTPARSRSQPRPAGRRAPCSSPTTAARSWCRPGSKRRRCPG